MKTKSILLTIALLLLITTATSIGISPGEAYFNNMARGGYGEKVLALSNAGETDLLVIATVEGESAGWITLQPELINNTLPKKGNLPFKVKVNLPPSVTVGRYTGTLVISTINVDSVSGGPSGAQFMPGLIVPIKIDVTGEELLDYEVKGFTVSDAEKDEMIEYTVGIKNKGNVQITPDLMVEILSQDKNTVLRAEKVDLSPILPTTEETIRSSISSEDLKIGRYWLRLTAYLREKVLTKKEVDFKILEAGSISIEGDFTDLIVPKKASPGDKVKITAYFNNTCLKVLDSQSSCEILSSGKLLDTVESKELRVEPGNNAELVSYYDVQKEGNYEFRCHVSYQNKQTPVIERFMTVESQPQADYMTYLIYLLILITTLVLAYTLYSRYRQRK